MQTCKSLWLNVGKAHGDHKILIILLSKLMKVQSLCDVAKSSKYVRIPR